MNIVKRQVNKKCYRQMSETLGMTFAFVYMGAKTVYFGAIKCCTIAGAAYGLFQAVNSNDEIKIKTGTVLLNTLKGFALGVATPIMPIILPAYGAKKLIDNLTSKLDKSKNDETRK